MIGLYTKINPRETGANETQVVKCLIDELGRYLIQNCQNWKLNSLVQLSRQETMAGAIFVAPIILVCDLVKDMGIDLNERTLDRNIWKDGKLIKGG